MLPTADLVDEHPDDAHVCELALGQYGGTAAFSGAVQTIRCFEDNALVRAAVAEPGSGRVLVVDGGGSLRVALVGDMLAALAIDNGWAGIVVNGAVRDVAATRLLPIGIKARGVSPRRSSKTGAGERDVPIEFGNVTFRSGAMLASDDDGIVVLDARAR